MEKAFKDPECPGYSHAPHTADELVVARGRSLGEAFEQAAIGVYEIMTDTSRVEPREETRIEVEGFDLENLLYRWIEELLIATDTTGRVFSKFAVKKIEEVLVDEETSERKYRLEGVAWGESFNPDKHEHRTIVKAMTYAQMEIMKEEECWRLQFVVDI